MIYICKNKTTLDHSPNKITKEVYNFRKHGMRIQKMTENSLYHESYNCGKRKTLNLQESCVTHILKKIDLRNNSISYFTLYHINVK